MNTSRYSGTEYIPLGDGPKHPNRLSRTATMNPRRRTKIIISKGIKYTQEKLFPTKRTTP